MHLICRPNTDGTQAARLGCVETSQDPVEERVLAALAKHVSPINARVIAQRGRRTLRDPAVFTVDERPRVLAAVRTAARVFVRDRALESLLADLDEIEHGGEGAVASQAVFVPSGEIQIDGELSLRQARMAARAICQEHQASDLTVERVTTAVRELARNIVSYTPGGRVLFELKPGHPPQLRIAAEDRGRGTASLKDLLGASTRGKPDRGLSRVRALMERFDVRTGPTGTCVTVELALR